MSKSGANVGFLGSQRGNPWTQCCVIDIAAGFRRRFFFADMSSVEKLWTTARRSVADFGRTRGRSVEQSALFGKPVERLTHPQRSERYLLTGVWGGVVGRHQQASKQVRQQTLLVNTRWNQDLVRKRD